ncbi:MAG: hypothetical protein AAF702_10685 [Chloroflexota bacterium]
MTDVLGYGRKSTIAIFDQYGDKSPSPSEGEGWDGGKTIVLYLISL